MAPTIDLNADMGESFGRWVLGDDASLMPQLTSANIACGFHGGDAHQMRQTVSLALEHGVGIGAHVGLPDLIGFGRRRMAVRPDELYDYVLYQAGAMKAFAEAGGGRLQHVKPHGILYSMIIEDAEIAAAAADATAALGDDVIFLLAGANAEAASAKAGIRFVPEGYVDLDYDGEGRLVLERVKQVRDPEEMGRRAAADRLVDDRQGRDHDLRHQEGLVSSSPKRLRKRCCASTGSHGVRRLWAIPAGPPKMRVASSTLNPASCVASKYAAAVSALLIRRCNVSGMAGLSPKRTWIASCRRFSSAL